MRFRGLAKDRSIQTRLQARPACWQQSMAGVLCAQEDGELLMGYITQLAAAWSLVRAHLLFN